MYELEKAIALVDNSRHERHTPAPMKISSSSHQSSVNRSHYFQASIFKE
ncbi:hypothetical protein HCG51_20615 [Tolypothrix sp. PCC 7910]|nr:hypothetical protein HCG51_20615 [Tolypothrix sp. PCC 7910]